MIYIARFCALLSSLEGYVIVRMQLQKNRTKSGSKNKAFKLIQAIQALLGFLDNEVNVTVPISNLWRC